MAFRDSLGIAKITQANSYGIFGEDLTSLSYLKPAWKEGKFKFTSKEDLPETGYTDFGARLYDKLVPRFITIDPLAETSRRFSPYAYGNNNPIRFIDPNGMASQGFEYSDGYSTMNSRNETGSVSHEGVFDNAGGSGDDKPKVKKAESSKPSATTIAGTAIMTYRVVAGGSMALESGAGWSIGEGALALGEGSTGVGALVLIGSYLMTHPIDITADIPITDIGTKTGCNHHLGLK